MLIPGAGDAEMGENGDDAARYRSHARGMRAVATSTPFVGHRQTFLQIAEDYDLVAEAIERSKRNLERQIQTRTPSKTT